MILASLSLLSTLILAPAGGADAPRVPRSAALAQSLGRKIADLEGLRGAGGAQGRTIPVSEGELNSYLNLSPGLRLPDGLSDLEFRFEQELIEASGQLDLDAVRGKTKVESGPLDPLALLSGTIPIEVKGRLKSEAEGFGAFEIQEVRLGPVSLPVSVLAQIVSSATRGPSQPQGFDIQAPFRLPYSLKRVRIQPGKALLEF